MKTMALGFSVLCFCVAAFAWSGAAYAGQQVTNCPIVDIATFNNRVHIHCTPQISACSLQPGKCAAPEPPQYFAVEASSAMAPTVIQIALAALSSKRPLNIFYDDNAAANPGGCQQNDCRRIIGVVIR